MILDDVERTIREKPGLTATQIARTLYGANGYAEQVNHGCLALTQVGRIERRGRGAPRSPFTYHAVGHQQPTFPNLRHATGTVPASQPSAAQPMTDHFNDPTYWRVRGEEVRAIAVGLKGPDAKRTMLEIATDCDLLAQHAEQRLKT